MKKIRDRTGASQDEFAKALGLKTYASVYHIEQGTERKMRGATLESLLDLLGMVREEDLDQMWQTWALPDTKALLAKIEAKLGPLKGQENSTLFAPRIEEAIIIIERATGLSRDDVVTKLQRGGLIPPNPLRRNAAKHSGRPKK